MPTFFFRAATGLLCAFSLFRCQLGSSDKITGTSSGVDNPELTVAFVDSSGTAMRVSGTLSLYGQDQIPAVDHLPLAQITLDNNASVLLSSFDFERNGEALSSRLSVLGKGGELSKIDTVISFNLLVRTDGNQGALAMGFAYDGRNRRFIRGIDSSLSRVDLIPTPLQNAQGVIIRKEGHEGPDRVFIPGTPFLAVLVDSIFVLEGLPEGLFDLKILTSDGQIVGIEEKLKSGKDGRFTENEEWESPPEDTPHENPDLILKVGDDYSAKVGDHSALDAEVEGSSIDLHRVIWLWRQVEGPPGGAVIRRPTESKTSVDFNQAGVYRFEVSASLATYIARDTLLVAVETDPGDSPRFIAPLAHGVLPLGSDFSLFWLGSQDMEVEIWLSVDNGETFRLLEENFTSRKGINEFKGSLSPDIPETDGAIFQLRDEVGNAWLDSPVFSLMR